MYYICVILKDKSRDYVCAPKGWRWTERGIVKDDFYKGGPEMSKDPNKKHIFSNLASAKLQAHLLIDPKIIEC